jgi:NADH-quinone oxidoreductase subunit C
VTVDIAALPASTSRGQDVLHPSREQYLDTMTSLRDAGFDSCMDVTAVDYYSHHGRDLPDGVAPERFEVVVNLISRSEKKRMRVRVQVPAADAVVPSLFDVWAGTEAMEREVYDLMGITFDGHPDLTRILMPEDWEGHPLRKDYATGRIPVQFKHPPATR